MYTEAQCLHWDAFNRQRFEAWYTNGKGKANNEWRSFASDFAAMLILDNKLACCWAFCDTFETNSIIEQFRWGWVGGGGAFALGRLDTCRSYTTWRSRTCQPERAIHTRDLLVQITCNGKMPPLWWGTVWRTIASLLPMFCFFSLATLDVDFCEATERDRKKEWLAWLKDEVSPRLLTVWLCG